jgi:predicted nucleic acid-binding protein
MKLFLDTSVLLAACGSEKGASRELFRLAPSNEWTLMTTPYVLEETKRNLPKLPSAASSVWQALKPNLVFRDDVMTLNQLAVFPVTKGRPVLFSALAWAGGCLADARSQRLPDDAWRRVLRPADSQALGFPLFCGRWVRDETDRVT